MTVAMRHRVRAGLHLHEQPLFFEVLDHHLPRLVAIETEVFAGETDLAGSVDDEDVFQPVALPGLKVVRVVRRGDLHAPGAEIRKDRLVGDHRDLAPHEREDQRFAHQILVAVVVGVDRDGGIAEQGLGTRRRDDDVSARLVFDRIADVPEVARLVAVDHLGVGEGGVAMRAPVRDAQSPVDQPLVVERHEDLAHRGGKPLVHREMLARPVAGNAEFFQLRDDPRAVFVLPVPDHLKELFAPDVVPGQPLLFAQVLLDLDLRGDPGVVGAGDPERIVTLHPAIADQNVLQRLVERVSHVQLPRDVRGRDHDRKRRLLGVVLGGKVPLFAPRRVEPILKIGGRIGFR